MLLRKYAMKWSFVTFVIPPVLINVCTAWGNMNPGNWVFPIMLYVFAC